MSSFSISANLEIITPSNIIEKRITQIITKVLNKAIKSSIPTIQKKAKEIIGQALNDSLTIKSLRGGPLQGHMGIISPDSVVLPIIETIQESMVVEHEPIKLNTSSIDGGLTINILKSKFDDVLALSTAKYKSNEFTISWLEWLLVKGNQIIWPEYNITFDLTTQQQASSRSGQAVMIRAREGWRVPPQHAGVMTDNFLTRALNNSSVIQKLETLISRTVESRIK